MIDPVGADPEYLFQRALALHQAGQLEAAIEIYRFLKKQFPKHPLVLLFLAEAESLRGNFSESLKLLDKSIKIAPENASAHNVRGSVLAQMARSKEALQSFNRALQLDESSATIHNNRGNLLTGLKRWGEALQSFERALQIRPDLAEAHNNRGVVLQELGRGVEALQSYLHAIGFRPDYGDAYLNLGILRQKQECWADAFVYYQKAIRLLPASFDAFNNCGVVLLKLRRFQEALVFLKRATQIKPDSALGFVNYGAALWGLQHLEEAMQSYDKAQEIDANKAEVCLGKGGVYQDLGRWVDAVEYYERAYRLSPDCDLLIGRLLLGKMYLCEWGGLHRLICEFLEKTIAGGKSANSFLAHVLVDSLPVHQACAETNTKAMYSKIGPPIDLVPHPESTKIRIGYFSSDFGDHPVSHLLADLFLNHDRTRFEVIGISFHRREDRWRDRIEAGVDRYVEFCDPAQSDIEVAQQVAALALDIAVDLNGHTFNARTGVFAERVAPVQVSYIGFLGTMGAPYIDYLMADRVLVPEGKRAYYDEKIVYLPTYQCNDGKTVVADRGFSRAEMGLPAEGFVFCSFNNNYKITPEVFDVWMRILKRVPGSVLWLFASNDTARENLRKEAELRGVTAQRLVFAGRLSLEEHLSRQRLAGLFLDTFPYNAGATASAALRAGLPLLTRSGESFASRYGASLLNSVGMPELVTETAEAYEERAVQLASDPVALAQVKQKLEFNLPSAPLFDTASFTRNIEAAYIQMHERRLAGLPPDHLHI